MRILLDECLDEGLRHQFGELDCQTCRYSGFKGLSNGKLLAAAEAAGFDVLVTVDQNLAYQQRMQGRRIALLVLQARTTAFDDILPLLTKALAALENVQPGEVLRID